MLGRPIHQNSSSELAVAAGVPKVEGIDPAQRLFEKISFVEQSMPEVDREAIRSLLLRWQAGEVSAEDVHCQAEAIFEAEDWPDVSETDARSIGLEVLTHLDILNQQLITESDIPALLDFLATRVGDEVSGWAKWRAYWEGLKMKERRELLKDNPFYCT